jgi:DNA-binding transcriptional ArsR family regulator
MYVAFELGARWGADKNLIPLLAPELEFDVLDEPLGGRNAIECKAGDLHKLISDVGDILNISPERPEAYRRHLQKVLNVQRGTERREDSIQSDSPESELTVPEYFGEWLHRFRDADLTEADQALIAGYFVQRRSEEEEFTTGGVTKTLKEARINLSNTSRSIRQLTDDGKTYPTRKDGRYQRYSVSPEGIDYLKSLLQEPVQP